MLRIVCVCGFLYGASSAWSAEAAKPQKLVIGVLFGTDFPIIEFRRASAEVKKLEAQRASREHLKWRNAARVYDLKPEDGFDWRTNEGSGIRR